MRKWTSPICWTTVGTVSEQWPISQQLITASQGERWIEVPSPCMVLSNRLPDWSALGQSEEAGKTHKKTIWVVKHLPSRHNSSKLLLQSVLLSWCCRIAPVTKVLWWVVLYTKKQLRCMELCYGKDDKSVNNLWDQKGSHKERHSGRSLLWTG